MDTLRKARGEGDATRYLGTADKADRAEPSAELLQGLHSGTDHLGVAGEPQVVIGAEVDDPCGNREREAGAWHRGKVPSALLPAAPRTHRRRRPLSGDGDPVGRR